MVIDRGTIRGIFKGKNRIVHCIFKCWRWGAKTLQHFHHFPLVLQNLRTFPSHMSLTKLRRARDHVDKIFKGVDGVGENWVPGCNTLLLEFQGFTFEMKYRAN